MKKIVIFLELCLLTVLLFVYVFYGELHVDESGYVYAAREIAAGRMAYHDFFFLQTPVFPYVYAIPFLFSPISFECARLYMMLFGIASIILTMVITKRLTNVYGVILVGLFYLMTPFQLRFFSIARMYPLATFWVLAGILFISPPQSLQKWRYMWAMVFFTLSFATRLTLLPIPFLFLLYVAIRNGLFSKETLITLVTGIVTTGFVFVPFVLPDYSRFFYNIIGFHLDITVGGYFQGAIHKLAGISRLVSAYFVSFAAFVLTLSALFFWKNHPLRDEKEKDTQLFMLFLFSILIVVGGGQFTAKFFQESYQTIVFPVLVLIVSILGVPLLNELFEVNSEKRKILNFFAILLLPTVLLGFAHQGLVVKPGRQSLSTAHEMASYLSENTKPEETIACSDSPLLPLLANRKIMVGFEGPEFFPFWSNERATHHRVLNQEQMLELITSQKADVFIINTQSFRLVMPDRTDTPQELRDTLLRTLENNYVLVKSFPHIFSIGEETRIYRPRRYGEKTE